MKSKTTEKPKTFKVTIIETLKREVIVHAGELKFQDLPETPTIP